MHAQTSPASDIAAALAAQAEAVCRHYLPAGERQSRYWIAGDVHGARGKSLFVRLHGPRSGKWNDYVAPVVMLQPGAGRRSCSRFAVSPQHNLCPAQRVA